MAGRETDGDMAIDPTLPDGECNVADVDVDGRDEKADVPGRDDEMGVVGVPGVEPTRARGDTGAVEVDGETTGVLVFTAADGGRGLETDADAPRPIMLLSRGGGGRIPETGADEGGMGSTVDCRCK